jgi:hypothetical protein
MSQLEIFIKGTIACIVLFAVVRGGFSKEKN